MMVRSMTNLARALVLWTAVVPALWSASADAQDQTARRALAYAERQDKIDAWTVGLATGLIEDAPLRLERDSINRVRILREQ
jgi:hypothetical protein